MGSFFNNTTSLKALHVLCGVMLLSQSIYSVRRPTSDYYFWRVRRYSFRWSWQIYILNTLVVVLWANQAGGGVVVKPCFFNFFQQLLDKIIQSAYLCVILKIGHKKSILAAFTWNLANSWLNPRWRPRWWPCLVTLRASRSATTHKIIPHLVEKIKGFPLKAKSFWNTATYQKL